MTALRFAFAYQECYRHCYALAQKGKGSTDPAYAMATRALELKALLELLETA